MTKTEMKHFLKSEGWCRFRLTADGSLTLWSDKTNPTGGWGLDYAYSLAYRRKRIRDTRRLKKAGWVCRLGYWWHQDIKIFSKNAWGVQALVLEKHDRQTAVRRQQLAERMAAKFIKENT